MAGIQHLDQRTVLRAVGDSLDEVHVKDRPLFDRDAHEVALVHRFGVYLEQRLCQELQENRLSVDLEYNRHRNRKKYLPGKEGQGPKGTFRPDLVVHHRGDDSCNVLAVEWRKPESIRELKSLEERVQSLLSTEGELPRYGYEIGVLIVSNRYGGQWCPIEPGQAPGGWRPIGSS